MIITGDEFEIRILGGGKQKEVAGLANNIHLTG
jgi:hypothetical protein